MVLNNCFFWNRLTLFYHYKFFNDSDIDSKKDKLKKAFILQEE